MIINTTENESQITIQIVILKNEDFTIKCANMLHRVYVKTIEKLIKRMIQGDLSRICKNA